MGTIRPGKTYKNMDYPATQTTDDSQPLVVVFRPADAIQAEIVRGTLEAEGIYAIVGEQVTGAYAGPFSVGEGAWGEIMVAEVDAERANALLADYDAQSVRADRSVDLDELTAQAEAASDPQV